MTQSSYDIIVLGAGPGGYVAAIRAGQLGKKVAIVESSHLGGICLNWGCIPTKALLRSSEIYTFLKHAADYGIEADKISFNLKKIVERSRGVADQLSKGIGHLLKKNKVDVITGRGQLLGKEKNLHQLDVTQEGKSVAVLSAPSLILATGARARILPGFEPSADVWTYKEAMTPQEIPKSLLVMGSGAIGIEFASFYRALGVEVTVVEVLDRLLPIEDEEISTLAQKSFEKQGMKILTQTTVTSFEKKKEGLLVSLTEKGEKKTILVEKIISAVGIVGNIETLGLEKTKIKTEKSHIVVNEWCETAESGIYAIGDVAGAPWLAHKASHEGVHVVERICSQGPAHPIRKENIPGCTYSTPQIASVGLTEKEALAQGYALKVGRFPFIGNGKAIALGEPDGLVKTIFDSKTGELLGAHMIGAEVTELIQGFVLAKTLEATEADLMAAIFPHPTLSEMMHESVLGAYGKAIHF